MNEPMVNLDHYAGRSIEDVNKRAGEWQIVLEGNVRIVNYSEDYEAPEKDDLVGLKLQTVTMSDSGTSVYFGTDDNPNATVVNLMPTEYGVADPDRFEGTVKPQAAGQPVVDAEEDAERLQEAPEAPAEGEPLTRTRKAENG